MHRAFCSLRSPVALAAMTLLTLGCAVGPDFEHPPSPDAKSYEEGALPEQTSSADTPGGDAQKFIADKTIPAAWWNLFRSEELNKLIDEAIKANPDLQSAEASLRETQEDVYAGEGALLPEVSGNFGATRERLTGAEFGENSQSIFTLYNTSVTVSYGLDIFGGARREIESLVAQKDYQHYQVEAAYISLSANVVTTAIREASLRAQMTATQDIIDNEKKQLDLLSQQFELGGISKVGVLAQAATLAQTEATLPPLENQLAQTRHQLSVLAGKLPNEDLGVTFDLTKLQLPIEVPLTLPSKLTEQRPDVRAAEEQLHVASAQIGVATANMLPQFTISGNLGSNANALNQLFSPGTGIWSIGGNLVQPIFQGGELYHKRKAAQADFDRARAQYRSTVLVAFQNVADTLHALLSDADTLKADLASEQAAQDSLTLAQDQYKEGGVSYLSLLTAEQTYQQTKIALIKAEASRFADTAALFQALGGGWWNRMESHDSDTTNALDSISTIFQNGDKE